jgi:hypothetical protein
MLIPSFKEVHFRKCGEVYIMEHGSEELVEMSDRRLFQRLDNFNLLGSVKLGYSSGKFIYYENTPEINLNSVEAVLTTLPPADKRPSTLKGYEEYGWYKYERYRGHNAHAPMYKELCLTRYGSDSQVKLPYWMIENLKSKKTNMVESWWFDFNKIKDSLSSSDQFTLQGVRRVGNA